MKFVSYEGTAPRMTALLGGHVLMGETNLTQLDKVKAGQLKMYAIATPKRLAEVPDVSTLKELGIDIVYAVNRGIFAPKGTPEAALAKLEEACGKAAKDPAVMESMKKQGTSSSSWTARPTPNSSRRTTRSTPTCAGPRL